MYAHICVYNYNLLGASHFRFGQFTYLSVCTQTVFLLKFYDLSVCCMSKHLVCYRGILPRGWSDQREDIVYLSSCCLSDCSPSLMLLNFLFFIFLFFITETELTKFLSTKGEKRGSAWMDKCRVLFVKMLTTKPDQTKGAGWWGFGWLLLLIVLLLLLLQSASDYWVQLRHNWDLRRKKKKTTEKA